MGNQGMMNQNMSGQPQQTLSSIVMQQGGAQQQRSISQQNRLTMVSHGGPNRGNLSGQVQMVNASPGQMMTGSGMDHFSQQSNNMGAFPRTIGMGNPQHGGMSFAVNTNGQMNPNDMMSPNDSLEKYVTNTE